MYTELLTFTIAAGETKRFEAQGRYFEIIDASYAFDVIFGDEAGGQSGRMRGALSGAYINAPFKGFEITNGSTAQTVTLMVTDGSGGSRRQPGNVRIIDNAADKTRAGKQFLHSASAGASAGVYSIVGLTPNAATAVVKRMTVSSATAGVVNLMIGTGQGTANPSFTFLRNKNLGGALSTSQLTVGTAANPLPSAAEIPGAGFWTGFYLPANTPIDVPLTTPIVVAPGNVIYVHGATINRDVAVVFDIEELL